MRELKTFRPLKGTVIVEASGRVEDNQWLLDLGKEDFLKTRSTLLPFQYKGGLHLFHFSINTEPHAYR